MDAAEVITLADAMRSYALDLGMDLNAANLFTHRMLVRSLRAERSGEPFDAVATLPQFSDQWRPEIRLA